MATLCDVNNKIAALRFTVQLSSTRRGARLARLLAIEQLRSWGVPFDAAAHVVAELCANAVLHGRVAGRDFRLVLTVTEVGALRIEVVDTRGDRMSVVREAGADEACGRGLVIVAALADRWGVVEGPVPRKTVWAEIDLAP